MEKRVIKDTKKKKIKVHITILCTFSVEFEPLLYRCDSGQDW